MREKLELPRMSLKERDRRWALTRKEMEARGLDCLVLWGWPAVWDFCTANARYLSPIGGNAEFNVLVFPLKGEPTSYVMMPTFIDGWKAAQDWISDVRPRRRTWADSAIERLTAERLSVRLAVSLHAPDDELRDELVPVNRRWNVARVLDAAWAYADTTGRRVSIEYAMIRDVNDQAWRAEALADLLSGRLAHVNLIPLNPTPGSRWTASDPAVAREFTDRIAARGVPVTVRDTRGTEIDGACGQLAAVGRATADSGTGGRPTLSLTPR